MSTTWSSKASAFVKIWTTCANRDTILPLAKIKSTSWSSVKKLLSGFRKRQPSLKNNYLFVHWNYYQFKFQWVSNSRHILRSFKSLIIIRICSCFHSKNFVVDWLIDSRFKTMLMGVWNNGPDRSDGHGDEEMHTEEMLCIIRLCIISRARILKILTVISNN